MDTRHGAVDGRIRPGDALYAKPAFDAYMQNGSAHRPRFTPSVTAAMNDRGLVLTAWRTAAEAHADRVKHLYAASTAAFAARGTDDHSHEQYDYALNAPMLQVCSASASARRRRVGVRAPECAGQVRSPGGESGECRNGARLVRHSRGSAGASWVPGCARSSCTGDPILRRLRRRRRRETVCDHLLSVVSLRLHDP